MDPEIQTMLDERFAILPPQLREFIRRPTTTASIRIIGEKHNLTGDKFITFENEVMLTLLAFEPLEQFDERLMAELLIPGSLAASIAKDLNDMVFAEVRGELQEIAKAQEEAGRTEEKGLGIADTVVPPPVVERTSPQQLQDTAPAKPLTDMPRYVKNDPYRESPK